MSLLSIIIIHCCIGCSNVIEVLDSPVFKSEIQVENLDSDSGMYNTWIIPAHMLLLCNLNVTLTVMFFFAA